VIALIDYGAGNLTSVRKALAAVGAELLTPRMPSDLDDVEGVIVPGVGPVMAQNIIAARADKPFRTLANLGSGFDIVSAGELRRVIDAGGDPRKCVFAGVGKTESEIETTIAKMLIGM
jgi:hypothetical protein